ncbi:MAG: glycosyltransferase [Alistipes sp.]|nr:glycosyltransferase [Alistipes sp.]
MNVLFVGSNCPAEMYAKLQGEGAISDFAAHTFQNAIVSGLMENGCNIEVLTAPATLSYPHSKQLVHKGFVFADNNNSRLFWRGVGFINLPLIRLICKFINKSITLCRFVSKDQVVIVYGLVSFELLATTLCARKNRKYVIVPDLPEYMSDKQNVLYRWLKKIDRSIIDCMLRYMDGYILLSQSMSAKLNISNKPQTVLEGIYQHTDIKNDGLTKQSKVLLYTGSIQTRYGLKDLLDAFVNIEGSDYKLWICGGGDVELVNRYMEIDNRIVYYGILPRTRVLELQREATLLVNPRHSNEEFTKYSFPSKTIEYMASGTPTVMCKLQCLPEEYNKHLFFFEDESIAGMSRKIKELLDLPSDKMVKFGKRASEFIIENKNAKVQTQKIIDMVLSNQ